MIAIKVKRLGLCRVVMFGIAAEASRRMVEVSVIVLRWRLVLHVGTGVGEL